MHFAFNLLLLQNTPYIILAMKKTPIFHPKLYFKYEIENNQTKLFYYSNQFDDLGQRLIEYDLLELDFFSKQEMYQMNEKQYHHLNIYIERQERVMNTYLQKGFKDQFHIVKTSINLMYDFKKEFDNWFSSYMNTFKIGIDS